MLRHFLPAFRMILVLTIVTGIGYPLLVTAIAKVVFPHQASGSLVTRNGQIIGSELIGQEAGAPRYFHSRPSAAGNNGYDATASGASNLGPTSQKLIDRTREAVKKFRAENPDFRAPIPADLLTASGSGLDPDISPASAYAQAARVAHERGIQKLQVDQIIASRVQQPVLGFIGEPTVNVLRLNLDIDRLSNSR